MRLENDSIYFDADGGERERGRERETTVQLSEIRSRKEKREKEEEEASSKFFPSPKEEFNSGTLVRETTRALGGGCSLRSYCFIIPIDGAVTGVLNFSACVKLVSPPMRFFNRVSASYLSG